MSENVARHRGAHQRLVDQRVAAGISLRQHLNADALVNGVAGLTQCGKTLHQRSHVGVGKLVNQCGHNALFEYRLLAGIDLPDSQDGVHLLAAIFGAQRGAVTAAAIHQPRNYDKAGAGLGAEESIEPA